MTTLHRIINKGSRFIKTPERKALESLPVGMTLIMPHLQHYYGKLCSLSHACRNLNCLGYDFELRHYSDYVKVRRHQ